MNIGETMESHISSGHFRTEHPHQQDFPMHIHNDSYEILYFLSGDVDYAIEGTRYSLKPGDLILICKGEVHHLILKSAAHYERMTINFEFPQELDVDGTLLAVFQDRILGKYNHYRAVDFPDNRWKTYLEKINSYNDPRKKLYYLLPLLNDLSEIFHTAKSAQLYAKKDPVAAIIQFINTNLGNSLSLDILAEQFYISKTHLNRIFKQSTGTTVWNYITAKRLLLARKRIGEGEPPTMVYSQCGFQDYTTFYRAYKQYFKHSPKNDIPK